MRFIRYTACAIALATSMAIPAFAQGTGTSSSSGATGTTGTVETRRDDDKGFDWGWLGLLGLAGLMGLRKQPDVHRTDATRPSVSR